MIAEELDLSRISWTRPEPIAWRDHKEKYHLYYPDFYLPEFGIYLDPKNPWVAKRDKEKIEQVSKIVSLLVGHPDEIMSQIEKLSAHHTDN